MSTDVAALITDLIKAGVDPVLVGRVSAALAEREAIAMPMPDEQAERRRAKDREYHQMRSAEIVRNRQNRQKSAEAPLPNKEAPAPQEINLPEETSSLRSSSKPAKKSKMNGHRLPTDWRFTDELRQWTIGKGVPAGTIDGEVERFRNHWAASAQSNAVKTDWDAGWRTWVAKWVDDHPQLVAKPTKGADLFDDDKSTLVPAHNPYLAEVRKRYREVYGREPPDGISLGSIEVPLKLYWQVTHAKGASP